MSTKVTCCFIVISTNFIVLVVGRIERLERSETTQNEAISNLQEEGAGFRKSVLDLLRSLDKKVDGYHAQVLQMKPTIGMGIEGMAAQWLRLHLAELGFMEPVIEVRKYFTDPSSVVHPNSKQFEVDVFCLEPAYIVECTAQVKQDGFGKLEKMLKKRNFLSDLYRKPFKAIFVTYPIDKEIKAKCDEFMSLNDIQKVKSR